jgi:hypothetical protein
MPSAVIYLRIQRHTPLLGSRRNEMHRAVFSHYSSLKQQVQIIFALPSAFEATATADCKT